jgi:hypothetical protein
MKGDMGYAEAVGYLREELAEKPYEKATLTTCYDNLENDRLRKRMDPHNGASLLLSHEGEEYLIATDSWMLTQQNIYAVYMVLYQLHQAEKWGADGMAQLLRGFRTREPAAPVQAQSQSGPEPWRELLGLGPTARLTDANATYRVRAKELAEDQAKLTQLNQAIEEARKALR